jgi:translation initiation factor 2B subunit (eIF-2B alpha/beta/delta family)
VSVFEDIAGDTTSGASALTRFAAKRLSELAEGSEAADSGAFWDEVLKACRELVAAKREMASIVNLASRVLAATERVILSGLPPDTARQAVVLETSKVWEFGEMLLEDLGGRGAALIPAGGTVVTVSSSESVRAIVAAAAAEGKEIEVLLSESRPRLEGIVAARSLREIGVRSTLVVDAALPGLVRDADVVLVGADSVSEDEFVNKVGTLPLALAAREEGAPLYVAALEDKFLPKALRGRPDRDHDPSELLDEAPPGIRPRNIYFEATPLNLVHGIVTECGIVRPDELAERLTARPVAPPLLEILFGGAAASPAAGRVSP